MTRTGVRKRGAWNFAGAVVFLAAGCVFVWAAYLASRVGVNDRDFLLESAWMDPWPQSWLVRGDVARFRDMNATGTMAGYRQAVTRNPLLFGAWFALARQERMSGDGGADALHDFLLAHVPASTPWSWPQLLLAADRGDADAFARNFNFVLANLPRYRQEAVEVALGFWGDWVNIVEHTKPENQWTLLEEAMARREADAAVALYPIIDAAARPETDRQLRFINFLLGQKRWDEAVKVWSQTGLYPGMSVANGQFEDAPTGKGFDWRQGRVQGAEARHFQRRDTGGFAMRFHFLGTANLRYDHFWQYLPLAPDTDYVLRFERKAERLSTDKGPYLEIRGVDCPGLRVKSADVLGTSEWGQETLEFRTPGECRMARIGVRRDESLKFDNKIAGVYWIDAVELVEKHQP